MQVMMMQKNGLRYLRFLTKETIDSLIAEHKKDAGKRTLQKKLAEEVTRFVHGKEELEKALKQQKNYLPIKMHLLKV